MLAGGPGGGIAAAYFKDRRRCFLDGLCLCKAFPTKGLGRLCKYWGNFLRADNIFLDKRSGNLIYVRMVKAVDFGLVRELGFTLLRRRAVPGVKNQHITGLWCCSKACF